MNPWSTMTRPNRVAFILLVFAAAVLIVAGVVDRDLLSGAAGLASGALAASMWTSSARKDARHR